TPRTMNAGRSPATSSRSIDAAGAGDAGGAGEAGGAGWGSGGGGGEGAAISARAAASIDGAGPPASALRWASDVGDECILHATSSAPAQRTSEGRIVMRIRATSSKRSTPFLAPRRW